MLLSSSLSFEGKHEAVQTACETSSSRANLTSKVSRRFSWRKNLCPTRNPE